MLIEHLPARSQLVLAGRGEPPLPLGRLRAERRLTEISSDDLAMSREEAEFLLRAARVD